MRDLLLLVCVLPRGDVGSSNSLSKTHQLIITPPPPHTHKKNSSAPGTIIRATRDLGDSLVTSLVLKNAVTLFDITSTRMLGQYGFLAQVFDIFRRNQVSVDVVATSEVSISLTLDPKRSWGDGEVGEELDHLVYELGRIANARVRHGRAILSLICNLGRTNEILARAFTVLHREGVAVQMISQGASKVNISLVVDGADGQRAVRALHDEFFGTRSVEAAAAAAAAAAGGNGKH